MAILEVNENQKQMLFELLKQHNWKLEVVGPFGSRSQEWERIQDMEDIRDLMNQMKGAGCN